jgi:hypothetical protein
VKLGDTVKLIGVPLNTYDDEELPSRTLFEKCLGKCFVVEGIEFADEHTRPLAHLEMGEVVGEESYMHSISVEPEYLELQRND